MRTEFKHNAEVWLRRLRSRVVGYPHSDITAWGLMEAFGRATVGTATYGRPIIHDYDGSSTISVGSYSSIAHEVHVLLGGQHETGTLTTFPFERRDSSGRLRKTESDESRAKHTAIGSDVWIGHGATILSGLNLGHGCVIGARSLVVTDVPAYAIYAGVPAGLLRYRFSQDVIDALLRLAWWELSPEAVRRIVPMLMSTSITELEEVIRHLPQ